MIVREFAAASWGKFSTCLSQSGQVENLPHEAAAESPHGNLVTSHQPPTTMLIFDAHLDLAWNAIDWNRDLLQPVEKIRESERGIHEKARGVSTVSFPEL